MPEKPGERLRRLREAKGWTQEDVARRSGVAQATISQLESGQQIDAMGATWRALADALDEMVDYLMCRIDRRDDPCESPGETPWLGRSALPQSPARTLCVLAARILARLGHVTQALFWVTNFWLACAGQFWHYGNVPYFPHTTLDSSVSGMLSWG